jgi:hypothetical protein
MIKRKLKRIRIKVDPFELKLEKFLSKSWFIIRRESKKFSEWLFFYKPEDKMDGILHILTIISYIFIGIMLARR